MVDSLTSTDGLVGWSETWKEQGWEINDRLGRTYVDRSLMMSIKYENISVPYECLPKEAVNSPVDKIIHMSVTLFPQPPSQH